jgi:hypothetical protein
MEANKVYHFLYDLCISIAMENQIFLKHVFDISMVIWSDLMGFIEINKVILF